MDTLARIASHDQMMASFEHLQSKIAHLFEVVQPRLEQRLRFARASRDMNVAVALINELVAIRDLQIALAHHTDIVNRNSPQTIGLAKLCRDMEAAIAVVDELLQRLMRFCYDPDDADECSAP